MLEQLDIQMQKKKEKKNADCYIPPYTKINLQWIIDLNVSAKTIHPFRRKHGRKNLKLG